MGERLVDVLKEHVVLHTYPISIGDSPKDADYEQKALRAAAHDHLVSDADLKTLNTRMHVSRGGPLAPGGDERTVLSQTREHLDEIVRMRAYLLWQGDDCPEGLADEYWARAHHQHLRERAYCLWQQEGCPDGRSDEFWYRTCDFERW